MFRSTQTCFLFLILVLLTIAQSQNPPVCNFIDNKCVQDPEVVSGLQERAIPELPVFVSCYLKFSNEDECNEPCLFVDDVFSLGGVAIGQCYPNITTLGLPQELSTNCFQNGTIWRKQFPCIGQTTAEECEAVQDCQWGTGEICGVDNSTITEEEREDMLEAFQGLIELSSEQSNASIVSQVKQSLIPDASYYCQNIVTDVLLCSIQQKPLNSECGDVLAWFWEQEQDRELFLSLEKCADQLKQTNLYICEDFFRNQCQYTFESQECSSSTELTDYLLDQVSMPSPSRDIMRNPVQCLLYGTDGDACDADDNCVFAAGIDNFFRADAQGICDGEGSVGKERLVQASLQVGASCFINGTDGERILECIQYPHNFCPEGCVSEESELRCIPEGMNTSTIDDVESLNQVLSSSLDQQVVNDGFLNIDYCGGELIDMIDCITRKRDFECAAEIVAAIFPNINDQTLLNDTMQCGKYDGQPQECDPNVPLPLSPPPTLDPSMAKAELKSAFEGEESDQGEGDSALRANFVNVVSMSFAVVLLTWFMM